MFSRCSVDFSYIHRSVRSIEEVASYNVEWRTTDDGFQSLYKIEFIYMKIAWVSSLVSMPIHIFKCIVHISFVHEMIEKKNL